MSAGRIFKVLICEGGKEEPTVEVTVPLKLAKWVLSLPAVKGKIQERADMDVDALHGMLAEMEEIEPMDLVKINDGEDRIRICIE